MNTTKLATVAGEYVADALKILLVWFISVMTLSGAAFANLTHQGSLITLSLAFAVWLSTCVAHYLATSDPTPPAPMISASTELLQVRDQSEEFGAMLRHFLTELRDIFAHGQPAPQPVAPPSPEPPAPPVV